MDVDALNSGYASEILEQYLENPESVPSEWRALFESGAVDLTGLPGLARLVERLRPEGNGNGTTAVAPPAPAPAPGDAATRSSSAGSPPRWRSSRRTACTATSPPTSTRSAPSRSATRRSSPSA